MTRSPAKVFLAAICLAAVCGCMELRRDVVSMKPEVTGDVWQIRKPGVVVSEPNPEGLDGEVPPMTGGLYRVAKTDSLVSIAQRFYGDRRYAWDIYELNKDAIRHAGGLKRGLVIALPAKDEPREGQSAAARP